MTGSARDVQAFFERVATNWDTMRLAYYDERVIEKMAEVASVDERSEVADVGTGTGFVAAGLAPRVKRVIGIDNASAMLRVARENLDALSVSNVELLVGDLAGLPLADKSVDAAFANMVLHHAIDPAAMLEEMARIVRPGGAIVITDEVEHHYEWMREEHADVWVGFTLEQVEGFFREAGLADYRYDSLGMQ
jgi:ubiquinone/menaquinone biosynthesis C-methylase UbiE